ncbi:hypothetical protein BDZ97DRAFT_4399 [Flammula alnicola]|nr:hypothetical protein BDZ97DRAFT_4399 [Flammula alnicola]
MLNRSQYAAMQSRSHEPLTLANEGMSFPPPYSLEHGKHEVDLRESFVTPEDSLIVSRYISNGYRYPQVPPEVPTPPSRSWSPIPSVHRESFPDEGTYSREPGDVGNQSWVGNVNNPLNELEDDFSAHITDPRISTMADVGQRDSASVHELRYIQYPETRTPPIHESWNAHPDIPEDENAARRQPPQWDEQLPETIESQSLRCIITSSRPD